MEIKCGDFIRNFDFQNFFFWLCAQVIFFGVRLEIPMLTRNMNQNKKKKKKEKVWNIIIVDSCFNSNSRTLKKNAIREYIVTIDN